MRMISYGRIREFISDHPRSAEAMNRWFEIAEAASWKTLADVRRVMPHCDPVVVASGSTVHVFNVGGNKYRVIAAIHFDYGRLFILRVLTHAEYDRNAWKQEL